jgi:CheY-like chemotaxis protein
VNLLAIRAASHRASDLVRQIARFSRQEQPRRERIEVKSVVDEAAELLRASLPRSIALTIHAEPGVSCIDGDPTQLHQIVMNLGTNAAHAMSGREGSIEMSIDEVEVSGNEIPEVAPGRYVRLCVADEGCGMDAATLQHVFEPFYTTKASGQGTGLGLSVVHGIAKNHGGTVTAESELGRGTTFRLYFPASTAQRAPAVAAPAPRVGGEHIFYVDDDGELTHLASRALRQLGYRVTTFTDAANVLAALRAPEVEVDAIVSDVGLPGMTGPELVEEVHRIRPGLRAILVSGYARPEDLEAARRVGLSGVVRKPSTMQEFARMLGELLARA